MTHSIKKIIFILLALLLSQNIFAINKALLIGVSEYQSDDIMDLPGISLDVDMMYLTAQRLGFEQKNIKRLEKSQASFANIKKMITGWLTQSVDKTDRVLIYFSGHGSRIPDLNGDESDQMDEVLSTYDTQVDFTQNNRNQQASLKNVLIDDDLYQWLAINPSQHLYFFVDACNSGTSYRSIDLGKTDRFGRKGNKSLNLKNKAVVKFLSYPQMKKVSQKDKQGIANEIVKKLPNVVFLSAAMDSELALATEKGSVFTMGLDSIIEQSLLKKQKLTPRALHKKITAYVQHKIQSEKIPGAIHHPQLNNNPTLNAQSIFLSSSNALTAQQIAINDFSFALKKSKTLVMKNVQAQLKLKSDFKFTIAIPVDNWYLNIVYIGTDGSRAVLFPNKYENNNRVTKGKMMIPDKNMPFKIRASKPLGNSYVYAFLSKQAVNFYQDAIDGFDQHGNSNNFLSNISARATRRLKVMPDYYAGVIKVKVVN